MPVSRCPLCHRGRTGYMDGEKDLDDLTDAEAVTEIRKLEAKELRIRNYMEKPLFCEGRTTDVSRRSSLSEMPTRIARMSTASKRSGATNRNRSTSGPRNQYTVAEQAARENELKPLLNGASSRNP